MKLADRIFKSWREYDSATDELYEKLLEIFGPGLDWTSITFDEYDSSFEAYEFKPFDLQPTEVQLAAVYALGFDRFWLHPTADAVKDYERYFGKKK